MGKRPKKTSTHSIPEYIVAIGGSAGGFEAFERFFTGIPPNTGMAFIVIQHLDPTHDSLLSELLQRAASIPVQEAADNMQVERDTIYVIPKNTGLSIHDNRLRLSEPASPRGVRLPIDLFFESLAAEKGEKSIGIIVSGMGTDGTHGLNAIKEASGVIMVQDPDSAKFDGMPSSAVSTGLADYIAPIEELSKRLVAYVKHSSLFHIDNNDDEKAAEGSLQRILHLLKNSTKHDFSLYKKSTLYRRIAKRSSLLHIEGIPEYASYVETHPEEQDILFREFLIGVTRFFRDPEAFDYLKRHIVPDLINSCVNTGAVRVWVAGCSTGEEAYSIAIVLREVIDGLLPDSRLQIQLFATDIDDRAISFARKGVYPASIADDISPERLERFFTETEGHYLVNKSIRETVVFALHDLVKDPPFTKIDIVSCRNILIYFSPDLQKKVMPIFHYALNPDGILFLGTAESTGSESDLFSTVNSKWKIYRTKETRTLPPRQPGSLTPLPFIETNEVKNGPKELAAAVSEYVNHILLEKYAPASIVVDANGSIIYISGRTGKYLELAEGSADWNICSMAREGLKHELAGAIYSAYNRKTDIFLKELKIFNSGGYDTINVTISPFTDPGSMSDLLMVVFEDVPSPDIPIVPIPEEVTDGEAYTRLAQSEKELALMRERLQSSVEEMEATQEELRSSNEELQSTNEEFQSTNEELITSKEELQSLNEELVTLNNELQIKVDDLTALNNDMANLMNSTQVATIFLDLNLLVRRFTPAVVGLFNLRTVDIGRPITDITQILLNEKIEDDLRSVLDTLTVLERQVESRDARWFIMRIMPYRTLEGNVDGVVVTLSDVTPLKQLEGVLRKSDSLSHALNDITSEISASLDVEPILPDIIKKASEAIGAGAGMISIRERDRWLVSQVFGLKSLLPGMQFSNDDFPYLQLIEEAGKPVALQDVNAFNRVCAKEYGIQAVLGVPLFVGNEFVGVLSLMCLSGSTVFTDVDIDFARKLGTAISLFLNNIHLYKAELKAKEDTEEARQILQDQHNLLQKAVVPTVMHDAPGYTLADNFIPGTADKSIGGDFYDVFETEDGKTALLIGDVEGKGIEAASLAVTVRSIIQAFAYDFSRPDLALNHANAVSYTRSRFYKRFATVFLAVLDPKTGQFAYASAGHPPPMILRIDGHVEILKSGQFPIGIDNNTQYISSESQLNPGDTLVMYTDGITESRRGPIMYGHDGIKTTLEKCKKCKPEKILHEIFDAAIKASDDDLEDDAAVVIIGRNA